jgi:2,4-dienoyl-CoA reductase (NADPH2)
MLYEAGPRIGGQLNLARNVPGKEEFDETLRYYRVRIARLGVDLRLGQSPSAAALAAAGFDEIVVATGVMPRAPAIAGIEHANCVSYVDILGGTRQAGRRVAVIGAGGIGFDVAEYLTSPLQEVAATAEHFRAEWGVDVTIGNRGGLAVPPCPLRGGVGGGGDPAAADGRQVVMLQRKSGRMGRGLGVSTGWVLRLLLAKRQVAQVTGVTYRRIDDTGVHITVEGEDRVVPADTVVICAGQEPARSLHGELVALGVKAHVIGGAERAAELDAMRAIDQGTRLATGF